MRPLKQAIYSSRTADKFVVRLPDGMRERIAEVAREHHRSMNSEIIARLEKSMASPDMEEGTMEVEAPEGTLWNPSTGMLVKTPVGMGAIQGVHYSSTNPIIGLDTVMVVVDGESYPLKDIKPIWLKS
ncbi:Arc-like DNA binding domain protein [compost metagenome]